MYDIVLSLIVRRVNVTVIDQKLISILRGGELLSDVTRLNIFTVDKDHVSCFILEIVNTKLNSSSSINVILVCK